MTPTNPFNAEVLYDRKVFWSVGALSFLVYIFLLLIGSIFKVSISEHQWIPFLISFIYCVLGLVQQRLALNAPNIGMALGMAAIICINAIGIHTLEQSVKDAESASEVKPRDQRKSSLFSFTRGETWFPPAELKERVVILEDSISLLKEKIQVKDSINRIALENCSKQIVYKDSALIKNEAIEDCAKKNSSLKSQLNDYEMKFENLSRLYEQCKNSKSSKIINKETDVRADAFLRISIQNDELIRNLKKFRDAGSMNPRDQMESLRRINEEVYSLSIALENYNKEMEKILNE